MLLLLLILFFTSTSINNFDWFPAAGSALQDLILECYVLVRTCFLDLTFSAAVYTHSR